MKTEFRPIAMKCTEKQFLTIKDRITLPIDWIRNFEYYTYLTNFYNGTETVTNIKESMDVNCIRESFHKFDGEFFLDCCGREIVEKEVIWELEETPKSCQTDVSCILSISEIKERLDNCIDLYTDLFCKKQEVYDDGWIGEIKGGINCFADAFLSFDDIRTDLELNAPKGLIFAWYWDNIENQESAINYYSYIKGLRISDIKF